MWKSERVVAGTPQYTAARRAAYAMGGRVQWVDEYNDYSVAGYWKVTW